MDSETQARIEQLERQVVALAHLSHELLDLLRNSALESWQIQERNRCEQLMHTLRTIAPKFPKR